MSINKSSFFLIFLFLTSSCIQEYVVNDNDTSRENFDLLWKTVDENYCFFQEKGIDWDSIRKVYEPVVSERMPDEGLFSVCSSMLNELKDGHVNLYSSFNTSRYWDWYLNYPQNFNGSVVERNYLGKDCFIAGRLKAQKIKGIGYLRFESFGDPISYKNVQAAIKQLGTINGVIIDIRDNGGGYVEGAKKFASCFFPGETLIGYIRYKEGPEHNNFSEYFPQYIKPDSSIVYNGKIAVLTNRHVFSAANYFVSIMNTLPNATIIGDVTGGGGGLPFSSELYNGWNVRISKNPMYNIEKKTIENGIEPDVHINMNIDQEILGVDTIIEYALEYLTRKSATI